MNVFNLFADENGEPIINRIIKNERIFVKFDKIEDLPRERWIEVYGKDVGILTNCKMPKEIPSWIIEQNMIVYYFNSPYTSHIKAELYTHYRLMDVP